MQEELTSDLGKMAAQLKSNSLAFGDLLEKDDQVSRMIYHAQLIPTPYSQMVMYQGVKGCSGCCGKQFGSLTKGTNSHRTPQLKVMGNDFHDMWRCSVCVFDVCACLLHHQVPAKSKMKWSLPSE
jgi:hypothetical protein